MGNVGALSQRIDERQLSEAKGRVALSGLVRELVAMRKVGADWVGLCPFHKENTPSFHVVEGKGFFHCFGCGSHGDHVSWLMQKRGMTFHEAAEWLIGREHVPQDHVSAFEGRYRDYGTEFAESGNRLTDTNDRDRAKAWEAGVIWAQCLPIDKTLAATYLRNRGIIVPRLPDSLRFHPSLYHSDTKREWPAMVAGVRDRRGSLCAIHRTYLDPATAKKIPFKRPKKAKGPLRDGAVRLGAAGRILGIAEGIETALSVKQLYTLPVWCSLGTSHMPAVWIPPEVEEVVIYRDNSEGKNLDMDKRSSDFQKQLNKRGPGFAWAVRAAEAFEERGVKVFIEPPPAGFGDFNDMLQARTAQ